MKERTRKEERKKKGETEINRKERDRPNTSADCLPLLLTITATPQHLPFVFKVSQVHQGTVE